MKISNARLDVSLARKGVCKTDLAKAGVVSMQTFRRIRDGIEVKPKTAGKIAAALEIDITEILKED